MSDASVVQGADVASIQKAIMKVLENATNPATGGHPMTRKTFERVIICVSNCEMRLANHYPLSSSELTLIGYLSNDFETDELHDTYLRNLEDLAKSLGNIYREYGSSARV